MKQVTIHRSNQFHWYVLMEGQEAVKNLFTYDCIVKVLQEKEYDILNVEHLSDIFEKELEVFFRKLKIHGQ